MKLTSELVPDTTHWRMALMFGPEAVEVVLRSTVEDNSMIHTRFGIDSSSTGYQTAVEEVLYANPLIVGGGFDRVICLCSPSGFSIIPAEADPTLVQAIMDASPLSSDDEEVICDDIADPMQKLAFSCDRKLVDFLRRTFTNPVIEHRLTPLLRYFRTQSRLGNSGKMYAHFSQSAVDLMVYGRQTVEYVNSFPCREPMDAVYYILSARELCGLSPVEDELILCGDADVRKEVTPVLRRYVASVIPAIFPSALYKGGREALTAPFNMTVLQLQ